MSKARPPWLAGVTLVTCAYLLVEFAFNARLLDVVGGMPTTDEVDSIERWGRCLSGFALALALWPSILERAQASGRSRLAQTLVVAFASIVIVALAYALEKRLVDSIVDGSSAPQRYVAANLTLLQHAMLEHEAQLGDLPLDAAQLAQPDGKAFMSLFPLLAMSTSDIDTRLSTQRPELVRRVVVAAYGGPTGAYNNYVDSLKAISSDYDSRYAPASRRYAQAHAGVARRQADAWQQYVSDLSRHHTSPGTLPRLWWRRAGDQVRAHGVPVPAGWIPSDRGTFDAAIARRIEAEALAQFRAGMAAAIPGGATIPPGLSPRGFVETAAVQARWRAALGFPVPTGVWRYTLTYPPDNTQAYPWFMKAILGPVVGVRTKQELERYSSASAQMADGGSLETFGRSSMAVLVVPPIALGFSLLGALVHVFKVAFYLLQLATTMAFRRAVTKFAAVVCGAAVLFSAAGAFGRSSITATALYARLEERTACLGGGQPTVTGKVVAFALRGVIQGEPLAYPFFEGIRFHRG